MAEQNKKRRGGKPNELSIEERLLMMSDYWREYRTYFYVAQDMGGSESTCYRHIKWIEAV